QGNPGRAKRHVGGRGGGEGSGREPALAQAGGGGGVVGAAEEGVSRREAVPLRAAGGSGVARGGAGGGACGCASGGGGGAVPLWGAQGDVRGAGAGRKAMERAGGLAPNANSFFLERGILDQDRIRREEHIIAERRDRAVVRELRAPVVV